MKLKTAALVALLASAPAALAAVVPNANAGTPGNGTFLGQLSTAPRTYQWLIHADQLTSLVGQSLSGMSYRLPTSATAAWPAADVNIANYNIFLSGSVDPAARSLTFANNVVGTQTQVRSGALTIPANSFTFGGTPNSFGPTINFDTPYTYAGGNLLIELRSDGFVGTSRSVDALTTSAPGYLSQFAAAWTGSFTGTAGSAGNFAVIDLVAVPAPSAAALLGLGVLAAGRRRR